MTSDRRQDMENFILRLDDARFVQTPSFIVLGRENQLPTIVAEIYVSLLTRRIGDPFGIAMLD